jgi:hypothetical protein
MQQTAAINTRKLKKADCRVDFFFMVEVHWSVEFWIFALRLEGSTL